jgi:hypothetical protein
LIFLNPADHGVGFCFAANGMNWQQPIYGEEQGFTPDGRLLYDTGPDRMRLIESATGQVRFENPGGRIAFGRSCLALSNYATNWIAGDGFTDVFDLKTLEPEFRVPGRAARFNPARTALVTLLDEGVAAIWDAKTGRHRATLGEVRSLVNVSEPQRGSSPNTLHGDPKPAAVVDPVADGGGDGGSPATAEDDGGGGTSDDVQSAKIDRYVQADAPAEVQQDQQFELAVWLSIDPPDPDGGPAAVALKLPPSIDKKGVRTGAPPVTVRINAPGFVAVDEQNEVALDIYADRDTPPERFRLRAEEGVSGRRTIDLSVFLGFERLGDFQIFVQVLPRRDPHTRAKGTLRVPGGPAVSEPPNAALYIDWRPEGGGDVLSYEYAWPQENWRKIPAGQKTISPMVSAYLEPIYKKLNELARQDAADEEEAIKIGQNLYRDLVTKELEEFYAAFCAKKPGGTLLVYSNEPWIPWELLYPWQSGLEKSDFLCAKFNMARWYYSKGQRIKPSAELRKVGISTPSANVMAGPEIRYLTELPQRWPTVDIDQPFPACASELLTLMRRGQTNLFHFATHGHLQPPAAINVAAIAVGSDHLLITDIVGDVSLRLGQSKPIMFMNTCHSARQDRGFTAADGWVPRFLESDCTAFIGANWEVNCNLASQFARIVYDGLLHNHTAAQAVKAARETLRRLRGGNSTWLAYSLYADPNRRVHVG